MMSASKLKPYPEYKDSNVNGLGKIPYHWSVERIATLGRISKGSGGSKEDNVESGLPCIRYGDLYTHHNFVVKDFKTQISAESASRYTTLKEETFFCGIGRINRGNWKICVVQSRRNCIVVETTSSVKREVQMIQIFLDSQRTLHTLRLRNLW